MTSKIKTELILNQNSTWYTSVALNLKISRNSYFKNSFFKINFKLFEVCLIRMRNLSLIKCHIKAYKNVVQIDENWSFKKVKLYTCIFFYKTSNVFLCLSSSKASMVHLKMLYGWHQNLSTRQLLSMLIWKCIILKWFKSDKPIYIIIKSHMYLILCQIIKAAGRRSTTKKILANQNCLWMRRNMIRNMS